MQAVRTSGREDKITFREAMMAAAFMVIILISTIAIV